MRISLISPRLGASCWIALVAIGAVGCGPDDPRGRLRHITGRLEVSDDRSLAGLSVMPSRGGVTCMGPQNEYRLGTFDITIYGDVAVDLQAARLPWMGEPLPPGRSVFSVGDLEGHVRGVLPGTSNVVIRLVPRTLGVIQLRALSLDGAPLADAEVRLTSMADWIDARTGTDGRVVVQDVPVRTWEVQVKPPRAAWPHAVCGRTTGTPGQPEFEVALRRSVVVRVRTSAAPPAQAFLSFGDARAAAFHTIGWLPGPDGTMELAIDPDWLQVRVRLERVVEQVEAYWSSYILAQATAAVAPGAVIDLKLGP